MERMVYPGEFYRHFKNKLYQIIAVATHSETKEKMVVYQALYGDFGTYVRPYEMFVSEVDHEKYPEVEQKYRFERVELNQDGSSERILQPKCERMTGEMVPEADCEDERQPSAAFLDFLECDDYEARMECLKRLAAVASQTELDSIYLILDMKPESGTIAEQTAAIGCFLTMQNHFDGKRLR